MKKNRVNAVFLPESPFPSKLEITNNLQKAGRFGEIIVLAVPSHIVRKICENAKDILQNKFIVNVAKGIEIETLMRMSEVIRSSAGTSEDKILTLSGPTHAEEVSKKLPATIVAASNSQNFAETIQAIFMTDYFRVYTSQDIIGVELGGATKNIIAIGAGISDGMNLGDNAKAALITRGIREITRFGLKFGAKLHTFSGISGMGDLIVTCESKHSRNRFVGEQLAKGKSLQEITNSMEMIAEGIKTTKAVYKMSKKMNVEIPITTEIYKVLFQGLSPQTALRNLMTRDAKSEEEF